MRVPMLEQTQVQASDPYPGVSPIIQKPQLAQAEMLGSIGKDIGQAGADVGAALAAKARDEAAAKERAARDAAKAKDEAEDMLVDLQVVGAQQEAQAEDERFKRNQGEDALRESGPTSDRLDDIIKKRSESFAEERLRARFKVKAGSAVLGSRKSIESHTSQQFLAGKQATLEGLRAGAIDAAGAGNLTVDELAEQVHRVDQSFDKQLPPDIALREKNQLRRDMSAEVIAAQIAAGNLGEAQQNIDDMGPLLGPKRTLHLKSLMASEKKKGEIADERATAEQNVQQMVDAGRGADGFMDETATESGLEKVPPEQLEDTRRLLAQRLNQEAAAKKRKVDEWKNSAGAAYNEGGYHAIPPGLVEKLQKYDSAFLRQLANAQDIKNARALAMRTGEVAKVRKQESMADKLALEHYRGLPAAERASTDVKQWVLGKGLSEYGAAKVQTVATRAKDYADKGFSHDSDAFTMEAEKSAKPLFDGKKAPMKDKEAKRATYRAEAQEAFDDFVDREKRAPSKAESIAEIGKLKARTTLDSAWWQFEKTGMEFERRAEERAKGAPSVPKPGASKLKPGRYESKSRPGTFFIVDEQGRKRAE